MTATAAILLVISAAIHAGWNTLGKRHKATAGFMLLANTLGSLLLLPALLVYGRAMAAFPAQVWAYLALTGLFQAVYYVGLANAYRCGDLSIAYPLLRATPVLIVTALTALLGQGEPLGLRAWAGMLLVVVSCMVLPMQRRADFRLKSYWNRVSLFALLAALGTVGYSLIDSEALKLARAATAPLPGPGVTAVYALLEGLASSLWLGVYLAASRGFRAAGDSDLLSPGVIRQALQVGVGIYAAYTLVLVAMGFVTNVSYVVAFRQLSIPLGALLGMTVLREPRPLLRLAGIAGVFSGLVLLGLG